MFYVQQLGGFVLVIIGTLILCSSYTEEYWYLPIDKEYGPYAALAIICLGAVIHELRPWKVLLPTALRRMLGRQRRAFAHAIPCSKSFVGYISVELYVKLSDPLRRATVRDSLCRDWSTCAAA